MSVDDAYTVSLLQFNGPNGSTVFTDESGKIWSLSASPPSIVTAQYKFGESGAFASGYIYTPNHADFSVGSGDFTMDIWVRHASVSAGQHIIYYHPGALIYSYILLMRSADSLILYSSSTGGSWNIASGTVIGTIAANTWYHVALARSGDNWNYFLDGDKVGTIDVTGVTLMDGTGNVYLGSDPGVSQPWDGWMDEFRFSKGIARWTDDFTPPTDQYWIAPACYLHARHDRMNMRGVSTQNQLE
jgi:hypothetical protein